MGLRRFNRPEGRRQQRSGKRFAYRLPAMDLGKKPLSTWIKLKENVPPFRCDQIDCAKAQSHEAQQTAEL